MKYQVRQRRPNYFSGFDAEVVDFDSSEELVSIDFIKNWAAEPDFYRLSRDGIHLMAELKEGRSWWVIGIFAEDYDDLDLPQWVPVND